MTNTATKQIDYAFATQCLVSLLERTTGLLCTAARGKGWANHYEQDKIKTVLVCADEFMKALEIEPQARESKFEPFGARTIRILGDLHTVTSAMLVEIAKAKVRPELFQPFETKHQIHHLYELASEFAAQADESTDAR